MVGDLRRIALWDNIPEVLKTNAKWAMATLEVIDSTKGTLDKAPRSPFTGARLSPNSDDGWVTFDEIVKLAPPAIGFRISDQDNIVCIDADKKRVKEGDLKSQALFDAPLKLFGKSDRYEGTYAEWSVSGNSYHIILLAESGENRAHSCIDLFRRNHFVIATGDVIYDAPVREGGSIFESLLAKFPVQVSAYDPDAPISTTPVQFKDETIIQRLFAEGGFHETSGLIRGDYWKRLFMSKPAPGSDVSGLEMELACAIVNHTRNPEQFYRIFRQAAVYRGDKGGKTGYRTQEAYDDLYLMNRTFRKAVMRWQARSDNAQSYMEAVERAISSSRDAWERKILPKGIITYEEHRAALPPIEMPPGLVGEMATYMFNISHKPMWEAAISGALAVMATYAGRHYNIRDSGLGLYIILAGGTGRGKETATRGSQRLMGFVEDRMPAASAFMAGGALASGQAGQRMLARSMDDEGGPPFPSKLLISNEIGLMFRNLLRPNPSEPLVTLQKLLLDVYSKGSWGSRMPPVVYSKQEDQIGTIISPNLTILGDMTPELLSEVLTEESISSGFIPRWLLIENRGVRPPLNKSASSYGPPTDIIDRLQAIAATVLRANDENRCHVIEFAPDAEDAYEAYDAMIDKRMAELEDGEVTQRHVAQVWNRASLTVLKLAGIIAVGCNHMAPVVTKEHLDWAIALVDRSATSMTQHSTASKARREEHRVRMIYEYILKWFHDMNDQDKKGSKALPWHLDCGVIPRGVLFEQVATRSDFQGRDFFETAMGVDRLFDNAISSLIKRGLILQEKPEIYADRVEHGISRLALAEFLYRLNERGA